jgi:hypothetical protein
MDARCLGTRRFPTQPFLSRLGWRSTLYAFGRIPGFDCDVLLEVQPGTENAFPVRQILFEHSILGTVPVPVLDSMLSDPERLTQYLRHQGLQGAKPVRVFATADEIPRLAALLKPLGSQPGTEWFRTEFEAQEASVAVSLAVTAAHFRAVAKIAFHYTLKVFPDLSGNEPGFEPIKQFISEGEARRCAAIRYSADWTVGSSLRTARNSFALDAHTSRRKIV